MSLATITPCFRLLMPILISQFLLLSLILGELGIHLVCLGVAFVWIIASALVSPSTADFAFAVALGWTTRKTSKIAAHTWSHYASSSPLNNLAIRSSIMANP
jgi:hypothetical protein